MHDACLYDRIVASLAAQPSGCWEWTMAIRNGYGCLGIKDSKTGKRRTVDVHRAIFIAINGPLMTSQIVRHKCDNTRCANPDHLCVGTKADNWRDAVERNRMRVGYHSPAKLLSKADVETLVAMSEHGASTRSLAAHFSIPKSTVRRLIRSRGKNQYWESRP